MTAEKDVPRNLSSLEEGKDNQVEDIEVSSVKDVDISDGGKLLFNQEALMNNNRTQAQLCRKDVIEAQNSIMAKNQADEG